MTTRRDFLGQIACALAVAGVTSRIPKAVFEPPRLYGWYVQTDYQHDLPGFTQIEVGAFDYLNLPLDFTTENLPWRKMISPAELKSWYGIPGL